MRLRVFVAAGSFALFALSLSRVAAAAPPYVDRTITLPRHDWAFDIGLGVGFHDAPPGEHSPVGPGINLEMAVGLTRDIELGVRQGLRLSDDARALQADEYGRLFDRETDPYAAGTDTISNPEFRLRGALTHGAAEIALEGRLVPPFARPSYIGGHTSAGAEFGVPMAFHVGHSVRFDTGVFTPVSFYDPPIIGFHFPLAVWIQVSHKVWLGPMAGLRFTHRGNPNGFDDTALSLGFGLGVSLSPIIDLKTMVYVPHANDDRAFRDFRAFHDYGAGIGLQFRIE
jgi:hypothetical protein